ncbi:hypothetical protein ACFYKT_09205 [Cytobacillus sp. FJAT-53684]|uniref:Transposase (putative) YhgA-like domain-containing protein n=1 Tax=Cytobacillus mangrovibacter TaxID=3299024 RepID=A0ABW6K199_9BACI
MVMNVVYEKPPEYFAVDYDGLWKKLIFELFEEFVLFFASDLYEVVDFTKEPEFLQQELFQEIIDEKKGKLVADQIVKVFLKSGEEKWLLIHVEVQGNHDMDFAKRMFRYYYRIFDKYDHDIVAIALLTDDSKHSHPNMYKHSSFGTTLTYEFNQYQFATQNEEELIRSSNPFAIAVLAANYANVTKNDNEKRLRFKRRLIKLILQRIDFSPEEHRIYVSALIYFIDYLLQIPNELTQKLRNEINLTKEEIEMMYLDRKNLPPTFGELMRQERNEGREKGRQEGKSEGIREARKSMALKLIQEEFTDYQIAKLTELSLAEIKKLRMN